MALAERRGDAGGMSPCFLGIGCIWAWIYCAFGTPAIGFSGVGSNMFFTASAAAVVAGLFASGWFLRGRPLVSLVWLAPVGTGLMVAGTLLMAIGVRMADPVPFVALSSIAIGPGFAWMCILWGEAFARLKDDQIDFSVLGSSAVTMLCSFIVPSLAGPVAAAVVVSLPVLSAFMLRVTYRESRAIPPGEGPSARSDGAGARVGGSAALDIVRVLVVLTAAYFVLGFMEAFDVITASTQADRRILFDGATLIGSSVGIVLALMTVRFSIRVDVQSLFRWAAPVLMLGVALFVQGGVVGEEAGIAIFGGANICMQAIAYLYFIGLAREGSLDIAVGIGSGQGAVQLGVLLGNVTANAVGPAVSAGAMSFETIGFALILLVAFSAVLLPPAVYRRERLAGTGEGDPMAALVAEAVREYGLSAREGEILGYLARGRSQPYIQEALYLSKSTVSTHVKHIYRKMDVHSKQELLNALEEVGAS